MKDTGSTGYALWMILVQQAMPSRMMLVQGAIFLDNYSGSMSYALQNDIGSSGYVIENDTSSVGYAIDIWPVG